MIRASLRLRSSSFSLQTTPRWLSNLAPASFKIKEDKVPAPWGHVSFQVFGETGGDRKPILAIHGSLDNSNSYKPLASYLCNNGYYIVSIDLPGHGFSSKLPFGNPITLQFNLSAVRRVVKYTQLKDFIMLNHSMASLLGLMYGTCFRNEIKGVAMIDWTFPDWHQTKNGPYSELVASAIDKAIESEIKLLKKERQAKEKPASMPPLTYDAALAKLMESNEHLDETAAKILLERGLVKKDNALSFSRDKRLMNELIGLDHYYEFRTMQDEVKSKFQTPIYYIYAWPPYLNSEKSFKYVNAFLADIRERSKVHVQVEKFAHTTSHHFHMVKPKETAELLLDFFAKHLK